MKLGRASKLNEKAICFGKLELIAKNCGSLETSSGVWG